MCPTSRSSITFAPSAPVVVSTDDGAVECKTAPTRCVTIRRMVTHGRDRRGFQSLCTYVAALMLASPACALSPDLRIKQFYHTPWTAKEGPPTDIGGLAQTSNRY